MGYTFYSHYLQKDGKEKRSCLDHIYTTRSKCFKNPRKLNTYISDHTPILIDLHTTCKIKQEAKIVLRRNTKKLLDSSTLSSFKNNLLKCNWEKLAKLTDVNEKTEYFNETYEAVLNK